MTKGIDQITAEGERELARASERVLRTLMENVRTRRRDAAELSRVVEALARARGVEAADYDGLMGRASRAASSANAADAHEGVISSMLAIIEADLRRLDRRIEMMSDTVDDDGVTRREVTP